MTTRKTTTILNSLCRVKLLSLRFGMMQLQCFFSTGIVSPCVVLTDLHAATANNHHQSGSEGSKVAFMKPKQQVKQLCHQNANNEAQTLETQSSIVQICCQFSWFWSPHFWLFDTTVSIFHFLSFESDAQCVDSHLTVSPKDGEFSAGILTRGPMGCVPDISPQAFLLFASC